MDGYIEIVNWSKYQHYKHRNPLWIKSYSSLLSCYEYVCLQDDSKLLYHTLLLMAGRYGNKIPLNSSFIQKQGSITKTVDLQPLVSAGFIVCYNPDSKPIEELYNLDSKSRVQRREEKSREETETPLTPPRGGGDVDLDQFDRFWKAYPRKVGKGAALRAWRKILPDENLTVRMIAAVEAQKTCDQWQKDGGQFIPHPSTWLNQQRWEDEPMVVKSKTDLAIENLKAKYRAEEAAEKAKAIT